MMTTESKTLFQILEDINNNKLVMPAFQREFEWDMPRIEKLWDSILQGYPFSTFLFWELDEEHISSSNLFYVFAKECRFDSKGKNDKCRYASSSIDFSNPNHPNIAVLDGQQRLTSLFISLYGTVYKRANRARKNTPGGNVMHLLLELDPNRIDETTAFNSKKFGIEFSSSPADYVSVTKFNMPDLLKEEFRDPEIRELAIDEVVDKLLEQQRPYARALLTRLCEAFYDEPLVVYTKVTELTQDDALEMFVRFNSGGLKLTKAEISMSILGVYWPDVQECFRRALTGGYANFGTDFLLRCGHMLFGNVVKSNIDQSYAIQFAGHFDRFVETLRKTEELFGMMNYDISRFASRWNIIIPIIYLIYNNDQYIDSIEGIFAYLFRAILFQYYASGTTGKLQAMQKTIADNAFKLDPVILDFVEELRVTTAKIDDLLRAEKDSMTAGNILYCLGINYVVNEDDYDRDHIHPQSRFGYAGPLSMNDAQWRQARDLYNRMPNLQLLLDSDNRSKGDLDFNIYYLGLSQARREQMKEEGFIPDPRPGMTPSEYYKIDHFLEFCDDRAAILKNRIKNLLNGKV